MSDGNWIKVAALDKIPVGKSLCVELEGKEILLCHTADGVYAIDNLCTHGAARLCEGKLKGNRVLCPMHGAAFDVRDGTALTRPAVTPLGSYQVRLDGSDVLLIAR
ncbi:non-heme iron oxygenase ferredoxin subunit [Halioglobus maricola]|uniref:Non-heme iron oxygenase ferredoxin subunit n=1 Tax=Halioglobus maricola TaxID=2601894 RepID=A0A5P9NH20_9GAMM|nr:non-heme iron oxygenase ferredoxin subunit [Halioglobus maricola]QFU75120.1 non-heme iron oxygenase ferredoxin subunit [Halioglobus maricola]